MSQMNQLKSPEDVIHDFDRLISLVDEGVISSERVYDEFLPEIELYVRKFVRETVQIEIDGFHVLVDTSKLVEFVEDVKERFRELEYVTETLEKGGDVNDE